MTATLAGLTVSGGSATYGGGIENSGALTVSESTIAGNSATYGGGIANAGTLAVSGSAIASNTTTYQGGGIYNFNYGLLTATNSTIANNSTGEFGSGGGIFNNNFAGTVTVNSSTISDNSTGDYGYGGGIDNGGALTIINSTIANNTAGYDAGGGGIDNGGTFTAVNTTIAYNQCSYYEEGGGVYDSSGAAATLDNTIVAVNTGIDGGPDDINGAPASVVGQYDLVGFDDTGSLTNDADGNQVIGATNPGLGLLAYNGGPTQTIALLAGSPAINAGSNTLASEYSLTTDQRGAGFPRIVDGVVDMGAYERAAPTSTGLVSSPNPSVYGQTITLTATVTAGGPATVYTVNSTGNGSSGTGTSGTLPYVISQANLNPNLAGSVIQFASSVFSASNPQTITLTSTLDLGGPSGSLVIDGPGAGAVTISGGGAVEVFLAEPGAVTTLSGLTISGGNSQTNGGGISVSYDSTLTITDSTVEGNSAASGGYVGGGIYNNGSLTVNDTMISGNSASQGGGIFNDNLGTLTVTGGSTIEGNTGGGITNNGITLTVIGSTIEGNTGGGIATGGTTTITDSTIEDNAITGGGCCAYGAGISAGGTLTITDSTIAGNTSANVGGAGVAVFGTATITGSTFEGNILAGDVGGSGAAIYNAGTLTVADSTIDGNSDLDGEGGGGGIDNAGVATMVDCTIDDNFALGGDSGIANGGTLSVIDTTITGNSAGSSTTNVVEGGGIANGGTVTLADSTISDNSTTGGGGGIYNYPGCTMTIVDSTVADNQSGALSDTAYGGGGINNQGTLTAVNTTIAYNQSRYYGGGVYDDSGSITTLYNTIVAVNTGGDGADDIAGVGVSSASAYNLVGVDETGSLTNDTDGNLVIGATNPGLGLPAYNGGPTQTIALLAGSPAIDAGSNALASEYGLTTDQRGAGFPRIEDGTVDIGAFERPLAASIGPATVYTVDLTSDTGASTGADAGDLAYVIGQANMNPNLAGSVICFDPTVFSASNLKTIALTSTLELGEPSGPMVIDGPGAGVVTISGGNGVGVFQVEPGAVTTLSGLTISGGSATNGGGIDVAYDGTMTVVDCTITANTAGSEGGGIASAGELTVSDSAITGNTAGSDGGGIYSVGTLAVSGSTIAGNSTTTNGAGIFTAGSATISGSTIQDNTLSGNPFGSGGGGISAGGTLTLTDCAITDNTAVGGGGGLSAGGTTTVIDCTVAGNSASGGAGGIGNGGMMTIIGSTIENNTIGVYAGGGGIANSGTLTLSGSTVEGNSVPVNTNGSGGGIWNSGTLTVTECTISDNSGGLGGGIYSEGTSCTVTDSTIADNSAVYGGGIENAGTTTMTVTSSTIEGNSTSIGGGGILNSGTLTLVDTTVADNCTGCPGVGPIPYGGGIDNYGTLTAVNTTIAYNSAPSYGPFGGGLYDNTGATATLDNTIVDANTAAGADDIDGAPGTASGQYNLVGVDNTGSLTNGTDGNQVGVTNPGLASGPANNGGPTQTIALLAGSPAIDAGSNALAVDPTTSLPLTADQRGAGFPRIVNGTVDIGAFEVQAGPVTTTTTTISPLANPPVYGQFVTFTATVAPTTGSGAPAGSVQFLIDGSDFGSPVPLVNGSAASAAISSLSVESHTIQADYSGAANFGTSTCTLSQTVGQDSTTTSFAVSMSTSDPGQSVTFMASVTANAPGSGTPAGTVQFLIDGSDFGSPVTLVNGSATSAGISSLSVASHTIGAVYSGGTDFATSTRTMTDTVAQHGTTTSVVSSASPSSAGQSVTFTATVSANMAGSGTPAGTVQFLIDGSDFGSPVTLVNGSATSAAISSLTVATHTIEAVYSGNTDFAGTAGTLTQTVNPANAPSAPPSVPPTGTVTFYVGAVNPADEIGTGSLSTSAGGVTTAAFSTHSLPAGTYAITAAYGGDANYPASTSNVVSQTVTPAPLAITAQNQAKVYGQANPALTVSYSGFVNGDTSASLTTPPTVTTTATASSPVGNYAITASGAVDPNYTISYVAGTLKINPAALTVTANNQAKVYGQANPALTVSYSGFVNGDTSASLTTLPTVTTTATTSSPVGSYPITASGAVDPNYTISYVAGTLTVVKASPTITTAPSPTSATLGTCTTLTDTATLAGGYGETGKITFMLYKPGDSSAIDTETVTVSGNGTYATPSGYTLPSSGATPGVYQWDAAYSGDSNNNAVSDNNDPNEQVSVYDQCCNLTNISYALTTAGGSTSKVTELSGATQQGETVTANFTVPAGDYDQLSLVSYNAPEPFYNADDANLQTVYQSVTQAEGPGQHSLSIQLPSNFYQVDFVCGTVIATLGPAGSNNFYHNQNRFIDGDNNGVNPKGSGILSVTGEVYNDLNVSGKLGSGDLGIANVTVTLAGTDLYGNAIAETTTTNSSGDYTFSGMPFSNSAGYAVSASPPSGYSIGKATVGTVNSAADGTATTSPEGVQGIVLASSTQTIGTGYNLGMVDTSDLAGSTDCIVLLSPTASGALTVSGSAKVSVPGAIVVDSSSSSAISGSGTASLTASIIDVAGGYTKVSGETFSPAPVTGAPSLADPLAGLATPSTSGLNKYGSVSLSSGSKTISPGIYSSISVSNSASLTMNAGTYIIEGGGFSISGSASVSGSGVTIYNAGSKCPSTGGTYGNINWSSTGTFSLSAPTSGTYAGILIFQSRDNTQTLTINVSGKSGSAITGTIYAAAAQLADGGTTALTGSLIVNLLSVSNGAIAATLQPPSGAVVYTPAQILAAYCISDLALDGTGQTIAIVDAYDDPAIFQSVDAFDNQFGLTGSGPTLFQQYGPSSSFLTVVNQNGQSSPLPETDPSGPGTSNWEVEEALDVEWAHAIAPGAQIILVEANSQSLSDLMAAVGTAAHQPGVSVVSMSWGFAEGQAVFASDEAMYDSYFDVPGVTFVGSTGDYGAADPEYPAFSPDVVAVGGTSLTLNGDGSYNSETGWGYQSDSAGAFIGSGGGLSLYEPEPAYQQGVQSTGSRTTPDVSLVADPATGVWIADPYNLDPNNPFEIVGGTSVSAPAWAGLFALINQGSAAAGGSTLNSSGPTETQQALYGLPQNDYNVITSGYNGYTAAAGYNLVTGLGTPVANLLVSDLVAYQTGTFVASGPTVGPLQNTGLVNTGSSVSGPMDVFSVFDSFTVTDLGPSHAHAKGSGRVESAVGHGMYADAGAARRLANLPVGTLSEISSAVGDGLGRPLTRPETAPDSAIDQVLGAIVDTNSHDTLIGDLAFEQVSLGARKLRGNAAI